MILLHIGQYALQISIFNHWNYLFPQIFRISQ
jgi:hypothetical protein